MGILAPLSSGRFQRLVMVFGRDLQPWHCHGFVNCLLTFARSAIPSRSLHPRVERMEIRNVVWVYNFFASETK